MALILTLCEGLHKPRNCERKWTPQSTAWGQKAGACTCMLDVSAAYLKATMAGILCEFIYFLTALKLEYLVIVVAGSFWTEDAGEECWLGHCKMEPFWIRAITLRAICHLLDLDCDSNIKLFVDLCASNRCSNVERSIPGAAKERS